MTTIRDGGGGDADARNAEFWEELCGSAFARALGIEDSSPASLRRFDDAYMQFYPYLDRYLPPAPGAGRRLLEIGLGYGTVGGLVAERGYDYHGLDVARAPVDLMRARLERLGWEDSMSRVLQGSALAIPYPDDTFDEVVTIGCLHHTGDIAGSVDEIHRVLAPGGRALVMVYNARSLRRILLAARQLPQRLTSDRGTLASRLRGAYDATSAGEAAPFTEFVSIQAARRLFARFASVRVDRENCDPIVIPGRVVPRERLLGSVGRRLGLDLYITATG